MNTVVEQFNVTIYTQYKKKLKQKYLGNHFQTLLLIDTLVDLVVT